MRTLLPVEVLDLLPAEVPQPVLRVVAHGPVGDQPQAGVQPHGQRLLLSLLSRPEVWPALAAHAGLRGHEGLGGLGVVPEVVVYVQPAHRPGQPSLPALLSGPEAEFLHLGYLQRSLAGAVMASEDGESLLSQGGGGSQQPLGLVSRRADPGDVRQRGDGELYRLSGASGVQPSSLEFRHCLHQPGVQDPGQRPDVVLGQDVLNHVPMGDAVHAQVQRGSRGFLLQPPDGLVDGLGQPGGVLFVIRPAPQVDEAAGAVRFLAHMEPAA